MKAKNEYVINRGKAFYFFPVLFSLMSLLSVNILSAQSVESLDSKLTTMEADESQMLKSLVQDLHSRVYLRNGSMEVFGQGSPVVAYCDHTSVNLLYEGNEALSQVELIRININSPEEMPDIDVSRLQSMPELKYLFVNIAYDICGDQSEDCIPGWLGQKISGEGIPVIYRLSLIN